MDIPVADLSLNEDKSLLDSYHSSHAILGRINHPTVQYFRRSTRMQQKAPKKAAPQGGGRLL